MSGTIHVMAAGQRDGLHVRVEGIFDFSCACNFLRTLDGARVSSQAPVLLDLTQVDTMSSAALGALLVMHERLGLAVGRAHIHCADPQVYNMLHIGKLGQRFNIERRSAA